MPVLERQVRPISSRESAAGGVYTSHIFNQNQQYSVREHPASMLTGFARLDEDAVAIDERFRMLDEGDLHLAL